MTTMEELVTTDNATVTSEAPPPFIPRYPALHQFSLHYVSLHGYIAAVVCIWGIIANIANIVVLVQKHMITSTNMILTWLAVADLLTMTSYFPVSIQFYIMKDPLKTFPHTYNYHWIQFFLFHISFSVVCHTIAIWLTIMLAIFRYLFICYPTKGAELCSLFRTKVGITATIVSTAIICIPNYLVTTIKRTHTFDNTTGEIIKINSYGVTNSDIAGTFLLNFNFWIQAVLVKLVPCVLLTILTVLLIHAMHQANQRRLRLKSQGRKDECDRAREHNRTTAMLLAIVALFLLTELPQGILTLCSVFVPNFFVDVYMPLGDVLDITALLNNSINFVLYCTMSRQFRDTFVATFCGCCSREYAGWLKVKTNKSTKNGSTMTTNV